MLKVQITFIPAVFNAMETYVTFRRRRVSDSLKSSNRAGQKAMKGLFKSTCLFLGAFFALDAGAQNLVRNPSFEDYNGCPKQIASVGQKLRIDHWTKPNTGSTDYYNACNEFAHSAGVPDNVMGSQKASHGDGYVGIVVGINGNYSEYVQNHLSEALIAGQTYQVKFKVSLAETSLWASSHLGCVFSKKRLHYNDYYRLYIETELQTTEAIEDEDGWTEVRFEFVAEGGENYLTIGCFAEEEEMQTTKVDWKGIKRNSQAYYYLDEVSVVQKKVEVPPLVVANVRDTFTLGHLSFASGSADLVQSQLQELDSLCTLLQKTGKAIEIVGHTDDTGDETLNMKLSERRAESVAGYLISKGVLKDKIQSWGKGSGVPKVPNTSAANRAINRRVEIVIL